MTRPFGILNVAKPGGMTSRQVVNHIDRLVRPTRVGHAGTLDPLATGVLVVCVGPATRLVSRIQGGAKTYVAGFRFGQTSDTDDITGQIVHTPDCQSPGRDQVEAALPEFVGEIQQRPPLYSAVHVQGKRAYELARRGQRPQLEQKTVRVDQIEILRQTGSDLELEITCGSGTYIRSLARDLGDRLGCGGLMVSLERTRVGPFALEDAVTLESLTADTLPQHLLPPRLAVEGLPQRTCTEEESILIRTGREIIAGSTWSGTDEEIALLDSDGRLMALAQFQPDTGCLRPRSVFEAIQ